MTHDYKAPRHDHAICRFKFVGRQGDPGSARPTPPSGVPEIPAAVGPSEFPGEQQLHLVLDNYGTHKTPQVQAWLRTHRRFVPHFIPTSSSWLNLVERWFGELTEKAIRRGAFVSVLELVQAIEAFLAAWNADPQPFVWTANLEDILRKIERARAKLESIQPGCKQPQRQKREV